MYEAAPVLGPANHEYEAIRTFHVPSDERRRLSAEYGVYEICNTNNGGL